MRLDLRDARDKERAHSQDASENTSIEEDLFYTMSPCHPECQP